MIKKVLVLVMVLGCISACSKRYSDLPAFSSIIPLYDAKNASVGRFKTSYLAEQIHAYYRGKVNAPLVVATFVDIDNLEDSSTFGRILSEQLISELSMKGYNVMELRHSPTINVLVKEGEFALSREIKRIHKDRNVAGVVVGTYVSSNERVYVNARLLDPKSSLVVSAGSVEMEATSEIKRLIRRSTLPQVLERLPVTQLGDKCCSGAPVQKEATKFPKMTGDLMMQHPPLKGSSNLY